jgi:hypothetical protein
MSKPTHIDKCDCDLCRAYLMPKIKLKDINSLLQSWTPKDPLDRERKYVDIENYALDLLHVVREMRKALKDIYSCVLSSNACEDCNLTAKQALDLVEEE